MGDNTKNLNAMETSTQELSTQEKQFDNLTILKELSNITNLVSEEEFLNIIPKTKRKHVNWRAMCQTLKQEIHDEMLEELNSMWELESMPEKLEILDKQKEKFADRDPNTVIWRPPLEDVVAQLKSHDMAILVKQKRHLEAFAKEYEARVEKLKKTVNARRVYLIELQMNIQKYQNKVEEVKSNISNRLENHSTKVLLANKVDVSKIDWSADEILQCSNTDDSTATA